MINRLLTKAITFFSSDLGIRFMAEAATRAGGFVITPLLSWSLGAIVFGSYLQIMSLSFAFVPVVSAGLGFTVIRRIAGTRGTNEAPTLLLTAISIVTALCLCLGLLLLVFGEQLVSLLVLDALKSGLWLAVAVPVLAWLFAVEAMIGEYLRALIKARTSLYIQLASFGFHMASLAIVLLIDRLSLETAFLSLGIAKLIVIAIALAPVLLNIKKFGVKQQRDTGILRIAVSGAPFMLAGLAEWAANLGDRLIVGRFFGSEIVAHYGAGIMLLSVITALGAPIWWLLFPMIAGGVGNGNHDECRQVVKYHTMLFAELALPVLALAVLVSNPSISILLNSPVTDMQPVILLAGIAILISQLTTGWEYFIVSVSAGKRLMSATITCSLGGFLLALYLAPVWGLVGIAAGTLIGKLCLGLYYAVGANRNGFGGTVWRTGPMTLLIALNVSAFFIASVLIEQTTSTTTSATYTLIFSTAIFASIYAIARLCLMKPLQHLRT
ncbi:MAG: oligosaccharide flippase family protein [Thalassospira sp.]|uniref:lipopolysaccharide biosynthesis protein n=1 Tax=Thalassospira sp. TaxID=1912094 RepID=UPI0032ED588B